MWDVLTFQNTVYGGLDTGIIYLRFAMMVRNPRDQLGVAPC